MSASIEGLSESTTYRFRIVATNALGTSDGADQLFGTPPSPPTVVTGAAGLLTQTSAKLRATVDPEGEMVSDCHFEYGLTEFYGTSALCTSSPGAGESPVAMSTVVEGLSESTTYHFRIVATNPLGTSYGADQSFTTLAPGLQPTVITGIAQERPRDRWYRGDYHRHQLHTCNGGRIRRR